MVTSGKSMTSYYVTLKGRGTVSVQRVKVVSVGLRGTVVGGDRDIRDTRYTTGITQATPGNYLGNGAPWLVHLFFGTRPFFFIRQLMVY